MTDLLLPDDYRRTPALGHLTAYPVLALTALRFAISAAMIIFAPPSHAGAPFVTDDRQPTEVGHFEIDLAAQYAKRHGGRSGAVPSLEVDYGALPNLELQVIAAFGFDRD